MAGIVERLRRPLTQFTLVTALGLVVVGAAAVWASQIAGSREALNEAGALAEQSGRSLITDYVTSEVLEGDAAALALLDSEVRSHVLSDRILRVKIWAMDGTIVYSDASDLVGEIHQLAPDRMQAADEAVTVGMPADLTGAEYRFERDLGQLIEVYLPVPGPDGELLLFEGYFDANSTDTARRRIQSTVVPITLSSLAVMGILTLLMALQMSRRMDRARSDREDLLDRALLASALERRRIAADLHDSVVQDLSGTAMLLSSAESAATDPLAGRLRATADALRQTVGSLRRLAIEIHPPNLESVDLRSVLEEMLEQTHLRHGLSTTFHQPDSELVQDLSHKRLIYRFVHEGLRNVVKHAAATTVVLTIARENSALLVSLSDDGRGYQATTDQPAPGEQLGLRLLGDIAAELGAVLSIGRNDGEGTTLSLRIPARPVGSRSLLV